MKTNIFLSAFLLFSLCLSMSHSQAQNQTNSLESAPVARKDTTNLDANEVLPTVTTKDLQNSTGSLPTLVTPINKNQVTPPSPQYAEYQSLCRSHDFDQVEFLSDSLKEKRIRLIQERLKPRPSSIKLKIILLKEYAEQKKISEAEQILKELRSLKIHIDKLSYAESIIFFARSEKKEARQRLEKILLDDPHNIEILKFLAEIYKSESNFYEATAIYYDLAKITKIDFDEQLCEVLTQDSHYTEAEKFCLRGAKKNKSPYYAFYLGIAAREKENLELANKYFLDSLHVKKNEAAYVCLGELFLIKKQYTQATENFSNALSLNPQSLRAHISLAWSLFNNKEHTQALETFKKACQLSKKTTIEVRKALKILLREKSEHIKSYSTQVEKCIGL